MKECDDCGHKKHSSQLCNGQCSTCDGTGLCVCD